MELTYTLLCLILTVLGALMEAECKGQEGKCDAAGEVGDEKRPRVLMVRTRREASLALIYID